MFPSAPNHWHSSPKVWQPREIRYPTFGREMLAAYLAIKNFQCFFFCLYSNHKPLIAASANASNRHSPREQRHMDYILQFTADVRHVKGEDNKVADALWRVFTLSVDDLNVSKIDFNLLPETQLLDKQL